MTADGAPASRRSRGRLLAGPSLAAGDGSDDEKGRYAGGHRLGERGIHRLVRQIVAAGEETQERAALLRRIKRPSPLHACDTNRPC